MVLKLERRDKLIPNPKGSRELKAHDRLLCFGKLEEMREEFEEYVRELRRAKDQEEFDRFMAERKAEKKKRKNSVPEIGGDE